MSENLDSRSRSDSSEVAFRKIFIGGLSYSTDEEKLKKYFKVYGSVQDAVVMKDPVSKRSRGFGFITFYDVSSVDNALANEPHTIDSRKVEAKRAVPRSEIAREVALPVSQKSSGSVSSTPSVSVTSSATTSPQVSSYKSIAATNSGYSSSGSTSSAQVAIDSRHAVDPKINMEEYAYNKIFVGGLHYDTRDAEFRSYFEKYGKVISAEVMFNRETHKSRGFGFIVFELEAGAVKVCAEKEHSIDGKVVEVKRAIPRSKLSVPMPAVSPATATSKSLTASPPSATNISTSAATPTAPVNIRSDVRRAMSEETPGSAKVVTNLPPPPLSSILNSATANSSLSNAIRKPYNAAVTGQQNVNTANAPATAGNAPAAAGVRPGTTSYAAALKQGGGGGGGAGGASASGGSTAGTLGSGSAAGGLFSDGDSGVTSIDVASSLASIQSGSTLTSASLSPTHGGGSSLSGGIDLQSLLNNSHIPGLEQLNRPFRSYSEPIVKIEGSSSLNGEIMSQFDLSHYSSRLGPSAAIGRSNNSSRSSSILATQSLSESGNSRRQSFDLLGHPQQQQQHSSVGLGQASNHTSSNSLANIPWLSSPPSLSLDAGDNHSSGLHNSGSSHMPGPLSLLLPGPAATAGGGGGGGGGALGGAGGSRNGGSTSSISGSVTPGNTVENLFGLPNPQPPAVTSPTSFGGGYQGITSLQALAQHQQQQYLHLQAQQAQQQQQLQQQQQQQLQAAYHAYQNSPHQSFNPGYSGSGSLLDASGLGMLPPAQHQVPAGPSSDVWASMVLNHQREQQQQQHMMQQQYPPYFDPHLHSMQQQQQQQQQQQSVPQPVYAGGAGGGGYFSPSGGSQPHPGHFAQQQSYGSQQQAFPGSPYFGGGSNRASNLNLSPSSQSLLQQPQQHQLPPPTTAGLNYSRSELTEGDDLFKFNDLHMDSAEFDPKAPWLYANKH